LILAMDGGIGNVAAIRALLSILVVPIGHLLIGGGGYNCRHGSTARYVRRQERQEGEGEKKSSRDVSVEACAGFMERTTIALRMHASKQMCLGAHHPVHER
jgi:hypothetical protein